MELDLRHLVYDVIQILTLAKYVLRKVSHNPSVGKEVISPAASVCKVQSFSGAPPALPRASPSAASHYTYPLS